MLEVEKVITKFRDYVIQQSRSNLSKTGHNNSKALYNSLKGEVVTENGYTIEYILLNNISNILKHPMRPPLTIGLGFFVCHIKLKYFSYKSVNQPQNQLITNTN